MAIVYVLWGVALLSSMAISLLSTGNVSHHLSRHGLQAAQADAIAEAAVSRAVLALLDRRPERRWRVDGVPQDFTFAGVTLRIAIQDELGRIDLNQADQSLLAGLFRSAGLDAQAASSLVDKILDWRDANPGRPTERRQGSRLPRGRLRLRTQERPLPERRGIEARHGHDAGALPARRPRAHRILGAPIPRSAGRPARGLAGDAGHDAERRVRCHRRAGKPSPRRHDRSNRGPERTRLQHSHRARRPRRRASCARPWSG